MFKLNTFYIFFFLIAVTTSLIGNDSPKFEMSPVPEWVKECEFPLETPVKPSQVNVQHLLTDTQRHCENQTLYWHFATKALTQAGVGQIAQFNINFDPSYQKLLVHKIRVYRDGEWHDRLNKCRLELLQREENLESHLYDGDYALAHFLEDIREGDIVDYACSFVGESPLFSSKYSAHLKLQEQTVTEKIFHRILSHRDKPIFFKSFCTSLEPHIEDISPDLRAWSWEAFSTAPCPYEPGQPVWHYPHARVQISHYKNWQEIAQIIAPLFALPENFMLHASPDMINLIGKWKTTTSDPAQQALLALRFVQDEIRYLGFEEGIGAFKPADPCLVFQRRFGDCKDKAFLLHALLHLMGIQSTPILVHSGNNAMLNEILPSPWAFNHVILQIDVGGRTYRCDPTQSLQGGCLADSWLPDYKWGLLVSEHTTNLTNLPGQMVCAPSDIKTLYLLTSPSSADLTICTKHYGAMANHYRKLFTNAGYQKMSEWFFADMKEKYPGATVIDPLGFADDRETNSVNFTEKYKIPIKDVSGEKVLDILALTVESYFDRQITRDRTTPYALSYPFRIREHIHIETPYNNWKPFSEEKTHSHESFWFRQHIKAQGTKADYVFELRHYKDHVPVEAVPKYFEIYSEIEKNRAGQITIGTQPVQQTGSDHIVNYVTAACALFFLGVRYYFYRKNRHQEVVL